MHNVLRGQQLAPCTWRAVERTLCWRRPRGRKKLRGDASEVKTLREAFLVHDPFGIGLARREGSGGVRPVFLFTAQSMTS